MKTRRLTNSEIFEKVREDDKVLAALDDVILAIYHRGEDKVSADFLKSVIAKRISVWADHEEEPEGLDGDTAA